MDLRILPLCAFVYLLNYLDRGNIGNAKVLNKETKDDMLSQTGMSQMQYRIAVSLFSLAYVCTHNCRRRRSHGMSMSAPVGDFADSVVLFTRPFLRYPVTGS